jgi:ABC-type multidrug transport system fused ATPase/permease subunit
MKRKARMKKLLKHLKGYTMESILAPLFKMLEATFELFVPLVMASIIDIGIGGGNQRYILKMGLILVSLALIGLVCSITAQYFSAKAAVGFSAAIRHALFEHVQKFSFTEMDKAGTSTLITRMTSDVNQAQNGVNMTLRLFLRSPYIVFGAMVMAFTIDTKAALVFAATIPLLSAVVFGIMMISIPLYKKVQGRLDGVLGITRENLTGARVLRAYNKEEAEIGQFTEKNDLLNQIQRFVGRISALMNPVTFVIVNAATLVLIYTGAIQVDNGVLTQGQVVALVNYMAQILIELIKLANLIITITKAIACANRIQNVLDMKPSMEFPESLASQQKESADAVVFENVALRYKDAASDSITGISFHAKRGQTIGIIGGTGSGKTSLVDLIPRFYDATEGRVLVDGIDVRDYPKQELRSRVGVVMQKAVLFKGSVRDNLRWGRNDATQEEMLQALDIAQSRRFVEKKADGLDSHIDQGGKNLSGGQKQRLTIARALLRRPQILILDDSSSALDFTTDARLRNALRGMKEKPTVFIISQRASSIRNADLILVLDDGEMVGMGTHAELLRSCPVYQEIYYSQFDREESDVSSKTDGMPLPGSRKEGV